MPSAHPVLPLLVRPQCIEEPGRVLDVARRHAGVPWIELRQDFRFLTLDSSHLGARRGSSSGLCPVVHAKACSGPRDTSDARHGRADGQVLGHPLPSASLPLAGCNEGAGYHAGPVSVASRCTIAQNSRRIRCLSASSHHDTSLYAVRRLTA